MVLFALQLLEHGILLYALIRWFAWYIAANAALEQLDEIRGGQLTDDEIDDIVVQYMARKALRTKEEE